MSINVKKNYNLVKVITSYFQKKINMPRLIIEFLQAILNS